MKIILNQILSKIKGLGDLLSIYKSNIEKFGSELTDYTDENGLLVFEPFIMETINFLNNKTEYLKQIITLKELNIDINKPKPCVIGINSSIYNINNNKRDLPFKNINYFANLNDELILQTIIISNKENFSYLNKLVDISFKKMNNIYRELFSTSYSSNLENISEIIHPVMYKHISNDLFLSLNKNNNTLKKDIINKKWKLVDNGEVYFDIKRNVCCKKTIYLWNNKHEYDVNMFDKYDLSKINNKYLNNLRIRGENMSCFYDNCNSPLVLTPLIIDYKLKGFENYFDIIKSVIDYSFNLNKKIINTLFSVSLKKELDYKSELMLALPNIIKFNYDDKQFILKGKVNKNFIGFGLYNRNI